MCVRRECVGGEGVCGRRGCEESVSVGGECECEYGRRGGVCA